MKDIRIVYCEINKDIENSVVEISLNYPKYDDRRKCYLYELFCFNEIKTKINERNNDILRYSIFNQDYNPFFIKISEECFKKIKKFLSYETKYEEHRWNDDVSLLQAILNVYRNDPKSWE